MLLSALSLHHILLLSSWPQFTYLDYLLFQMETDSGYSSTAELQKQVKAPAHLEEAHAGALEG